MSTAPQTPPRGSRLRRGALATLRLAAVPAVLLALLLACQSKLVYYPTSRIQGTPADAGLRYEEVSLTAADGTRLAAWWVPAEEPRAVLLLCHGNGGNISHRVDLIALMHRIGIAVLAFDYRGYGQSEGGPDEEGTYLDAEAAFDHLVEERVVDPARIVIHGRSLGGAIAAHTATTREPGALILDSAFTSLPDVGAEVYPFLPVRLLSRYEYATREHAANARCPVLVIHSRDDELVGFHHGEALFAAAPEPKRFLEISGGHNDAFFVSDKAYADGIAAFVADHLP